MDSLSVIIPFIIVGGLGALVLFIVAVVQESKSDRKGGFRQAFYTVVSLVMLTITVGSSIALLNVGFRQFVFTSATTFQQRYSTPPALYLPSQGGTIIPVKGDITGPTAVTTSPTTTSPSVYQCTTDCQLTTDDKAAVEQWVTSYQDWQKQQSSSLATRRSLANALGFLIVGLPLFIIFFRWVQRGHKQEQGDKPSPLRSLYFYGVAFAGLVMAVVATGIVINDGLKVWLKTGSDTNVISQPVPALATDYGVKSLLACSTKCGFTSEQVSLANHWLTDNTKYTELQRTNQGQYSSDLAMAIPFVVVGLPLFLYHFTTIRKDSTEPKPSTPAIV